MFIRTAKTLPLWQSKNKVKWFIRFCYFPCSWILFPCLYLYKNWLVSFFILYLAKYFIVLFDTFNIMLQFFVNIFKQIKVKIFGPCCNCKSLIYNPLAILTWLSYWKDFLNWLCWYLFESSLAFIYANNTESLVNTSLESIFLSQFLHFFFSETLN